ncbi:DUF1493 family protein [Erwinia mallotivora]|uniref:Acyl carrier protein n=1 Tax=Erwinia mallotivora TaxID=69222 RepID=A0A014NKU8_9GAMM|nr:DUF1493 family protein [Erwinia mallotivora]EXU74420.1 hypothetical protein BG55_16860 [Erwinia mallotivora]
MNKAESVRRLIAEYFWDMPDDASLSTGKNGVLPEEANDFFEEYAESLHVDMSAFYFRKYFPNEGVRFLPGAILPKYMQTDHHQPAPLTVEMLIESAVAGRWLY